MKTISMLAASLALAGCAGSTQVPPADTSPEPESPAAQIDPGVVNVMKVVNLKLDPRFQPEEPVCTREYLMGSRIAREVCRHPLTEAEQRLAEEVARAEFAEARQWDLMEEQRRLEAEQRRQQMEQAMRDSANR